MRTTLTKSQPEQLHNLSGESSGSVELGSLNRILHLIVILLSLGASFCLFRAVVRYLTMVAVARGCGISHARIWQIFLHYNEELRAGSLSVCDVACVKLFSETTGAMTVAMVAGGLLLATVRARLLAKALNSKRETGQGITGRG
jgi:hypothetical protein